jgi:hypothetical protein
MIHPVYITTIEIISTKKVRLSILVDLIDKNYSLFGYTRYNKNFLFYLNCEL